MEYFATFIPILLGIIFFVVCSYVYNRRKQEIEYQTLACFSFLPSVLISLLFIVIMSCSMKSCGNGDTEYLSYYVTKIRHTDKWNEYIHRTCERRVRVGTDSKGNAIYRTERYDCSYVETHPERWIATLNNDDDIYLHKDEFEKIKNTWKVPMVFVDMHRHYHTIDGDAQDYIWNNDKNTIKTYTFKHTYTNKIHKSQSTFKLRDVSKEEAKELGLYDYPEVKEGEQNPIIGFNKYITDFDVKRLQYINAFYGKSKQFRTFLLIYPNSSASIVDDQRCYWQGGNKNEFITCVGINDKTNEIEWVSCFSWLDDITMEVECRSYLLKDSVLNVSHYSDWLENNMSLWKRKEFKDFDYIEDNLEAGEIKGIYITIIILNIIVYSILTACFIFEKR